MELVLEDHAVAVPGFPRRSAEQPKLRAFIDVARRVLGMPGGIGHTPRPAGKRRPAARRR